MVLTKNGNTAQWSATTGIDAATNVAYTIVMKFDYNNGKYSVSVNGTPLAVSSATKFDIVSQRGYVKDIDFLGSGSMLALEGVQYEGKMAVDQDGVRYATLAEALTANSTVKGAVIKLLHGSATTSAEGWNFDSETRSFFKKALGLIFLAF